MLAVHTSLRLFGLLFWVGMGGANKTLNPKPYK